MDSIRDRFSTLWLVALAVLFVGVVLAVMGLIAGGPDEGRRDTLRSEVAQAEREVRTARSELDSTVSLGQEYASGTQAIVREGDQFCGCGQRGRQFQKELESELRAVLANPSNATINAYQQAAIRANNEKERFGESLDELRSLHATLAQAPGG